MPSTTLARELVSREDDMDARKSGDSNWMRKFAAIACVIVFAEISFCSQIPVHSGETDNRVLVLGGGGPVGEAWESGIVAGLTENGVDLSNADRIIGTSAGAIVGARLALGMPEPEYIDAALAPSDGSPANRSPNQSSTAPPPPDLSFLGAKLKEKASVGHAEESIRAIGEWAQRVRPVVSESQFVASYERRFPENRWPRAAYECISVDTDDGSLRVWNQSSGVRLALAVASSCALPGVFAPIAINGHRFMDGGVRSVTNADLARGCTKAVILAPTTGLDDDQIARDFTQPLDAELRALRSSGCGVELLSPDAASLKAFRPSIGDESRRAPALEAGRVQGRRTAARIATLWNIR